MDGSPEQFRRLIQNFPDGIVFLYEGGDRLRYTFVNGESLDDLGITREMYEGRTVAEGRPPEIRNAIRSHYRQALDGDQVTFEIEVEGRHFRIDLVPVTDDSGAVVCGSGVARDVTEQTVYEEELKRQNQHLEQVTQLVSHDLRNPLNVAMGRLELLKEEHDSDQIPAIERSLARMESLVEELLTLNANRDREAYEAVDLRTVAETAWQNVEMGVSDLQFEGDLRFRADEGDLRRLFENLYRNAVDHGGDGVDIRVGTSGDGFYVEDDGAGIPAEERDAVFDRGFSSAEQRTGLGLFIVANVAEAHGWEIAVADSTEGGARFEVTGVEPESRRESI